MCEPTTMAMMALSGGQAILGNKAQVDAASARNRNKKRLYDNDVSRLIQDHNQNISLYYLRGVDAEHAWDDAAIEANRNANQQQVILNEGIAQALQATQDDYVKLAGDLSVARSLEKSGVSARRARVAARAKLGRAKAAREAQQDIALDKAAIVFAEIQRIKQSKIREADRMIGLEPERGAPPPEPVWDKGPSMFQQLMNIGMAVGMAYLGGKKTPTKTPNVPGYEVTGGASVPVGDGTWTSAAMLETGGQIPTGAHGWGFSSSNIPYSGSWANLPGGVPWQQVPSGPLGVAGSTSFPIGDLSSQRLGQIATHQTNIPSNPVWGVTPQREGMKLGERLADSFPIAEEFNPLEVLEWNPKTPPWMRRMFDWSN